MSDNDRESPETVVAISTDDAAGPGTDDDAGDGSLAPLRVGEASISGELMNRDAPLDEAQNMKQGTTYPLVIVKRQRWKIVFLMRNRPNTFGVSPLDAFFGI